MGFKKFCSLTLIAALFISLLSFAGNDVEVKAASSGLWLLTNTRYEVADDVKDGGYSYDYSFNGIEADLIMLNSPKTVAGMVIIPHPHMVNLNPPVRFPLKRSNPEKL